MTAAITALEGPSMGKVVCICPGIGGGELYVPNIFGGQGYRIWLEPLRMIGGAWILLGLAPDGITPSVPFVGPLVPGQPLPDYYGALADYLWSKGWEVVAPSYDWRRPTLVSAQAVVQTIRDSQHDGPVNVIAHSRGGLVVRDALGILAAAGQLGMVGRCAGLGVPHLGSYYGPGMIGGWADTVRLLTLVLQLPWQVALGLLPFPQMQAVVGSWPSAYELFPKPGAPGLPGPVQAALYSPSAWLDSGVTVSAPWLAASAASWATTPDVQPGVQWIDVYGYGGMTPVGLNNLAEMWRAGSYDYDIAGDGVVPAIWALQPGRPRIQTPTGHGALIHDGRVLEALHHYLEHGRSTDLIIQGEFVG